MLSIAEVSGLIAAAVMTGEFAEQDLGIFRLIIRYSTTCAASSLGSALDQVLGNGKQRGHMVRISA